MKEEKKNMLDKDKVKSSTWRKLDNSAKVYPIISSKRFSNVFRLSVVLKEKVDCQILIKALHKSLEKYDAFRMQQKKGLFWNYLEKNDRKIIVEEEKDYPCRAFDNVANNRYLFKVTYFDRKINLEIFHSLTDGNSAVEFLKEITENYLDIAYNIRKKHDAQEIYEKHIEDDYLNNYDKEAYIKEKKNSAFIIEGHTLPFGAISATHLFISTKQIKEVAKKEGLTITEYITSRFIKAIKEAEYLKRRYNKKPIRICVPINLKKYFASSTLLNFFACCYIEEDFSEEKEKENLKFKKQIFAMRKANRKNKNKNVKEYEKNMQAIIEQTNKKDNEELKEISKRVKDEFNRKINPESIKKIIAQDVKLGKNFIIRILPLILKRVTLQLTYSEIRKYATTTISNVGAIKLRSEYEKYVDSFLMLLSPEKSEKIKCAVSSFQDNLVITFTSIFSRPDIEKVFIRLVENDGIKIKIEGNGVYDVVSRDI